MTQMVYIAYVSYSPEDTAIGLGADEDAAVEALVLAYPPAKSQDIDVVGCPLGTGLQSLEAELPLCSIRPALRQRKAKTLHGS